MQGQCHSAKTFQAIRELLRGKEFGNHIGKLTVNNDQGERIMDDVEAAVCVARVCANIFGASFRYLL
jgi:hypothetical protein